MSEQDRCSLHQASVQDLYQRSSGKISCKNSIRALLARSPGQDLQKFQKGSLGKISVQAPYKKCLGKMSVRDFSFCASLRSRKAIFKGQMPNAKDTTSIEHRALTVTVRTLSVATLFVWGKNTFLLLYRFPKWWMYQVIPCNPFPLRIDTSLHPVVECFGSIHDLGSL